MTPPVPPHSCYRVAFPHGVACRGCDAPMPGRHAADCPIVALRESLREVGAQLGLYVVTVRELLDEADRLLRDDAPPPEGAA